MDFDFFGNQISAHSTGPVPQVTNTGIVENRKVPIPHFGAVLEWNQFRELAERIRTAEIDFVIEPMVRFEGRDAEQVTMFLCDPAGNALEFKSYRNPHGVFAR